MSYRRMMMAALVPTAALCFGWSSGEASSHREAPAISNDPSADNTDTYTFISTQDPDKLVIVACYSPLQEPSGGPNWYGFAEDTQYVIHIDNDGDAKEEITYVFDFRTEISNDETFLYATGPIDDIDDPDFNFRQYYDLTRVEGVLGQSTVLGEDLSVPPVNIGPRTFSDYESVAMGACYTLDNGVNVFAGQRDDPFFVDLGSTFDLLGIRVPPGNTGGGRDDLSGYNVQALVLEIPIENITRDGSNPEDPSDPAAVIGVWASARRMPPPGHPLGGMIQVSRLGMPLVNEVVIPLGQKDAFNASKPNMDGQFLDYVVEPELAGLLQALYGIDVPPGPRCDLVTVFLTGVAGLNQPPGVVPSEMIRVNIAIKPDGYNDRFGVLGGDLDGFPNGRRLFDDVVDIEERVVAGVLYGALCDEYFVPDDLAGQLGDGIDSNDLPFSSEFPFLATPHQGFEHEHHRMEDLHAPEKTESSDVIGILETPMEAPTRKKGAAIEPTRGPVFELGSSTPNPAYRSGSAIAFQVPEEAPVSLTLFDANGREVRTLVDGTLNAGEHLAEWDGRDDQGNTVTNGIYFYRLESNGSTSQKKLVVLGR